MGRKVVRRNVIQVTGYGLWNMGFGLKFLPKPRLADILMTVSPIIDMSRIWTPDKTQQIHDTLVRLYVQEEKTIFQIANLQGITAQTVYSRLKRFGIPTNPKFKKRQDLTIPKEYTAEMAEFFGIMTGDGHVSHFQIHITVGLDYDYSEYVVEHCERLFGARPSISYRKKGYG